MVRTRSAWAIRTQRNAALAQGGFAVPCSGPGAPRLGRLPVVSEPADARPGIARAPMKPPPGRQRAEGRWRHREAAESPMPAPQTMSPRFAARLDRTKTAPDQADLTQPLMLVRYPG